MSSVAAWVSYIGMGDTDLLRTLDSVADDPMDLAFLTGDDWDAILGPMKLKLAKRRRVQAAIDELQTAHARETPEV